MRSGRFGVVLLWATVAPPDDDGERAALARVIHEIDALKPLIAEAEVQANPDARVKFHSPGSNRIWITSNSASGSTSRRPAPNRDRFPRSRAITAVKSGRWRSTPLHLPPSFRVPESTPRRCK
jgi:hypothetical protein